MKLEINKLFIQTKAFLDSKGPLEQHCESTVYRNLFNTDCKFIAYYYLSYKLPDDENLIADIKKHIKTLNNTKIAQDFDEFAENLKDYKETMQYCASWVSKFFTKASIVFLALSVYMFANSSSLKQYLPNILKVSKFSKNTNIIAGTIFVILSLGIYQMSKKFSEFERIFNDLSYDRKEERVNIAMAHKKKPTQIIPQKYDAFYQKYSLRKIISYGNNNERRQRQCGK